MKKHFVPSPWIFSWSMVLVATVLQQSGHRVTAMDLGASGVDPRRVDEMRSIHDYLQPLMQFMASLAQDEKVILVGHSYGGLSISLAMERFPEKVLVAIFVSAYMPNCKDPPSDLQLEINRFFKRTPPETVMDCQFSFEDGPVPTIASLGPNYMAHSMYQHCEPEIGTRNERYGSIDRVYVICEEDRVMREEFQRWNIQNSPPQEVKFMAGADHMVMLSQPLEFSQCLQEIAQKYK
ncbi:LOW QUALITY PROTEIN: Alpha/beta hydrolase fold-1 [Dillenia turbinata]|uniref:Alpha/beta hydrolase fold-1 n=1 Tax=Dillenia turbinata TaxID=194707 RepID=A0AAN8V9B3_9MAGN